MDNSKGKDTAMKSPTRIERDEFCRSIMPSLRERLHMPVRYKIDGKLPNGQQPTEFEIYADEVNVTVKFEDIIPLMQENDPVSVVENVFLKEIPVGKRIENERDSRIKLEQSLQRVADKLSTMLDKSAEFRIHYYRGKEMVSYTARVHLQLDMSLSEVKDIIKKKGESGLSNMLYDGFSERFPKRFPKQ